MQLKRLNFSDINIAGSRFSIPYRAIPIELSSSIKSASIINPPIVLNNNGSYELLTGFKRAEACRQFGITDLDCLILEDCNDLDKYIKIIYEDNKNRFTDVETGQLCSIYLKNSDGDVKSFLEIINLPATERHIERFESLSNLDNKLTDYYLDEKLNADQCFTLSQIHTADALVIAERIIIPHRFNTNETRELIADLGDISVRDKKSIDNLIAELLTDKEKIKKDEIRAKIKLIRNPWLAEAEIRFEQLSKELKLPKNCTINHALYFESNFIELKARVNDEKKMREYISILSQDDFKLINEIIELVKKGPT